jgi:hypothetical protein
MTPCVCCVCFRTLSSKSMKALLYPLSAKRKSYPFCMRFQWQHYIRVSACVFVSVIAPRIFSIVGHFEFIFMDNISQRKQLF